jgi:hypothetical protein
VTASAAVTSWSSIARASPAGTRFENDALTVSVIQKYQTSSCDQLWQQKAAPKPKSPAEEKVVGLLRTDARMREEFINLVSGPIVTKMFECGMVP